VCFGHWGEPRELKCKVPCEYTQCDEDKIPNGSIYVARRYDYYGTLRSLAKRQCWTLIGIIVQTRQGECGKVPQVFTILYNGRAELIPLSQLSCDPLIERQAVLPRLRACNECVSRKINEQLFCEVKKYLNIPFQCDGSQVVRNIFGLPARNVSMKSMTDTQLVYSVLFATGLLGDKCACDDSSSSSSPPCRKPQCRTRCTCDSSSSSTPACDKSCSKSSQGCSECQIDCLRAGSVTIGDFLQNKICATACKCEIPVQGDNCLNLLWFGNLVPVATTCPRGGRDAAIDAAFAAQSLPIAEDFRDIVDCFQCGKDTPCEPQVACSKCNPCGTVSCPINASDIQCALTALNSLWSQLSGVQYGATPVPPSLTPALNGNFLEAQFNTIQATLASGLCQKPAPFLTSSSYTVTATISFTPDPVVSPANQFLTLANQLNAY
jgi:hypothetical protein